MKIAILGTGAVGSSLGRRWGQAGHVVFYGALEPDAPDVMELVEQTGQSAKAGRCRDAVAGSDIVLLALPWEQVRSVLESAADLKEKILIDCINPMLSDLTDLQFGFDTSAAEQIAAWFPESHVVKAFNVLSSAAMQNAGFGSASASLFYCGADGEAKSVVRTLGEELGFEPVDCGPLRAARWLESMAMLYIHLAVFEGWGGDCAFKMLKR